MNSVIMDEQICKYSTYKKCGGSFKPKILTVGCTLYSNMFIADSELSNFMRNILAENIVFNSF